MHNPIITIASIKEILSDIVFNYSISIKFKLQICKLHEIVLATAKFTPSIKNWMLFMGCIWCVITILLINCYAGSVILYLVLPKPEPTIIQSFDDMTERTDLRVSVEKGSLMAHILLVLDLFFVSLNNVRKKIRLRNGHAIVVNVQTAIINGNVRKF